MNEREAFEAWFKEKSPVCGINAKLAARDAWLARAAVEADRAHRVPDGWANLLKASREVLSWTQAADRPPVRDKYECGRMTGVRVHALADLHEAVQVLASTPAPAQQEPVYCTYPACQSTGKTCLGACAKHAAQHQEPPQPVERKPMVDPCPGCTKGHVCRTPKCGRLALPVDHPLRCPAPGIRE